MNIKSHFSKTKLLLILAFLILLINGNRMDISQVNNGENVESPFVTAIGDFNGSFRMNHSKIVWEGVNTYYGPNRRLEFEGLYPSGDVYEVNNSWVYFTNEYGVREKPISEEKTSLRVLFLGNSRTAGRGVQYRNTYLQILEDRLESEFGEGEVEILNAGMHQGGMPDYYLFLTTYGEEIRPDVVIAADVGLGSNLARAEHQELTSNVARRVDEKSLDTDLISSVENQLMKQYIKEIDGGKAPSRLTRYGDRIKKHLDKKDSDFAVTCGEECAASIQEWTSTQNVPLIETPEEFQNMSKNEYQYPDGHLNRKGHKLVADHLFDSLDWEKLYLKH